MLSCTKYLPNRLPPLLFTIIEDDTKLMTGIEKGLGYVQSHNEEEMGYLVFVLITMANLGNL